VHGGQPHPAGAPLADEEFHAVTAADLGEQAAESTRESTLPIDPPVVVGVPVDVVMRVVGFLVAELRGMAERDPVGLAAIGPAVEDVRQLADALTRAGRASAHVADLAYIEHVLGRAMRYTEPDAVTASAAARAAERWRG
jgi:hypothetical protein